MNNKKSSRELLSTDDFSQVEAFYVQDYPKPYTSTFKNEMYDSLLSAPQEQQQLQPQIYNSTQLDSTLKTVSSQVEHDLLVQDSQLQMNLTQLLNQTTVYELVPKSSKIIVVDSQLHVKKVFQALLTFEMRGVIIWNSSIDKFEGMFTITDFLKILIYYNTIYNSNSIQKVENQKIAILRDLAHQHSNKRLGLITLSPNQTVLDAFEILTRNRIHRLPVVDETTNNAIFIVTHKRIINYLYNKIKDMPKPSYFYKTIRELNIGTYENVIKISYKTTINQVLHLLVDNVISALPIVDDDGKLVDIYSKSDATNLAGDKAYTRLDAPIISALIHRQLGAEGVLRCLLDETFDAILERIVDGKVHRLIVVNPENYVIGVVSLSDILKFLVLQSKILAN